jgi:quinol monooxygenase YgiN
MAEDTLRVIARVKARADKVDELRSVLSSLVEPTRKEAGCLGYTLLQNNEDPTDFTLVEEWESKKALEFHLAAQHFKDTQAKLPGLVAAKADIRLYHLVK